MITSPGKSGTRSAVGDWLEIRALLGQDSNSSVVKSVSSTEGEDRGVEDEVADDGVETEIAENSIEDELDIIAEELGFRSDALGEMYPFKFESLPSGDFGLTSNFDPENMVHSVYVFMLLVSVGRDKRIELKSKKKLAKLMNKAGTLFHVCASIGVAGLIQSGRTYWFGFPRPDGTNFEAALKSLSEKMVFPVAKTKIPAGMPKQAKDEEIDIVGWRPFVDKRVGGMVVLCQAASGKNWNGKSILGAIPSFSKTYFQTSPYGYGIGAIAYPFMAHHDVELDSKDVDETFEDALNNRMWKTHSSFGVVLDRMRISEAARDVFLRKDFKDAVAGVEKLSDLQKWNAKLMKKLNSNAA